MNDEWDEEEDNWYGDDDESEYESEDNDPGQLRLCIHCGSEYYDLVYQLLDQGITLEQWPRCEQDEILDDADLSNQIGRAVVLIPAFINTPIRPGQRLEFVTNRPKSYTNQQKSGEDNECPF
jgi:hypothetical protein